MILYKEGAMVAGKEIPNGTVFQKPGSSTVSWDSLERDVWRPVVRALTAQGHTVADVLGVVETRNHTGNPELTALLDNKEVSRYGVSATKFVL